MGGEGKPELSREEWLRRVMEREREARPIMEWVMCPTCCGFVWRKKRSAMPYPDDAGEGVEMLADSKEMCAAVMPKLVMEPDAATEILQMRTRMMLEHERCPTCYRPLSNTPETKPCKEDKMVAAVETMGADSGSKRMVEMVAMNKRLKENKGSKEGKNKKKRSKKNKKKRSKNKNKRSTEEPRGGEKWKMVTSEGEAMVADLGSREDNEYCMGCTRKSSSGSPEYPMGRTEKSSSKSNEYYTGLTRKSSSEGSEHSTGLTGKSSSEGSEYSMGPTGKRRTKMVTCRLSKEFVQYFIQTHSPSSPFTHITNNNIRSLLSRQIAKYEVECVLHAYWQSQCDMKGYAEYQEEVTDYEDA